MSDPKCNTLPPLVAQNFPGQLKRALEESTLTRAMAFLCICEANRIAISIVDSRQDTPLPAFDSCFTYILTTVRDAWIAAGKPLTDFQPRFCPPPPPH